MITENEEKKDYLRGYERTIRQMERSELKIREMRMKCMSPSVNNDGMPHAHNNNDLSGYAAMLDEEITKYARAKYDRLVLCKEITEKIEIMRNEDEKDVLMYRYINLMKWEDICVKIHRSWKQTHRIHSRALTNFKI